MLHIKNKHIINKRHINLLILHILQNVCKTSLISTTPRLHSLILSQNVLKNIFEIFYKRSSHLLTYKGRVMKSNAIYFSDGMSGMGIFRLHFPKFMYFSAWFLVLQHTQLMRMAQNKQISKQKKKWSKLKKYRLLHSKRIDNPLSR